jgi:hypothetical protein
MTNALQAVQATFLLIDAEYSLLRLACTSQQQRDALAAQYAAAEDAYEACIDKMLEEDNPDVAALSTQLNAANAQVKQSVAELGDMSKVIDHITTAVTLGAQLAAKRAV